jgi:hypothetical protein
MTSTQTRHSWFDYLERHSAAETEHSERHLLEHLIGTERLLRDWGAPEHVCRAGLMHSIYGTESFDVVSVPLEDRDEVRSLIGERAERIAYLFCVMARDSFFDAVNGRRADLVERSSGRPIALAGDELGDLCDVAVANWLELRPFVDPARWNQRRDDYQAMVPLLSHGTSLALSAVFGPVN